MHARLNPLKGKYYGTIIEIVDGPLEGNIIEVWLKSDDWDYDGNEPSDRELAHWNITREEHNQLYRNDPDTTPVDISGGHYESIDTLRVATIIVEALAGLTNQHCDSWGVPNGRSLLKGK
jgi:hypothetical protein